jgi:hypothetical protein
MSNTVKICTFIFGLFVCLNCYPSDIENLVNYNLDSSKRFTIQDLDNQTLILEKYNIPFIRLALFNNKATVLKSLLPCQTTSNRAKCLIKFINQLITNHQIDDSSAIFLLGDMFFESQLEFIVPVFAGCRKKNSKNIICVPQWDELDSFTKIQGSKMKNWNNKINKVFWRGNTTGVYKNYFDSPRFKLVDHPSNKKLIYDFGFNYVNVQENQNFLKHYLERNQFIKPSVDKYTQSLNKYLVAIDGNTYPSSFKWQLSSQSVVLKIDSVWEEWFYKNLVSNFHYISINSDLSNLENEVGMLMDNDLHAQEIGLNASTFFNNFLKIENIEKYFILCLKKYWIKIK